MPGQQGVELFRRLVGYPAADTLEHPVRVWARDETWGQGSPFRPDRCVTVSLTPAGEALADAAVDVVAALDGDAGELVEEFSDGQVQPGAGCFAAHQVGDLHETTWGSLSWRKLNSASDWER